jgi:flavin-dependent dehydrogenase
MPVSDGSDDYDVIIVGGGPVGQGLGLLLGDRGWRTAVIERWSQPYSLPRAWNSVTRKTPPLSSSHLITTRPASARTRYATRFGPRVL